MGQDGLMVLLGGLLGFLSGLFGVGGSSVATPLLRLLNVPRLIALATPLPVTLPTAVAGAVAYWRKGVVDLRAAFWTAAGGVPAVVVGSYLTAVVPGRLLMLLTGGFVMLVGARVLRGLPAEAGVSSAAKPRVWQYAAVGLGIGFLSGLLANGGGFLLVPAYLLLFHMEAQEAAATSLVAVALLAIPGTLVHWSLGHVDLRLALLLTAGVVPTTFLGAKVGMRLTARQARTLFGGFLLLFGGFFALRTLYRAETHGWQDP
jgi:uncharacterized membrane protein YfcA